MSRLPNILSLFRIVGGITLLLCDVEGTTFQKKLKKTLDSSLGACFNFAADFEISRESLRHSG